MTRELKILKAILMLRKINKYQNKEKQIADADKYYTNEQLDQWIATLKEGTSGDNEELEALDYFADEFTPSSTNQDYSPSSPWNAPGMSISDFI